MTRRACARQQAVLDIRDRNDLIAERNQLVTALAGCTDPRCACHDAQHWDLANVLHLLGEGEDPGPRQRWWEEV